MKYSKKYIILILAISNNIILKYFKFNNRNLLFAVKRLDILKN